VVHIYPRALGSLSVASYDSQGYGGGILSRLLTGNLIVIIKGIQEVQLRFTKPKSIVLSTGASLVS
jgi:hypothetical protein